MPKHTTSKLTKGTTMKTFTKDITKDEMLIEIEKHRKEHGFYTKSYINEVEDVALRSEIKGEE